MEAGALGGANRSLSLLPVFLLYSFPFTGSSTSIKNPPVLAASGVWCKGFNLALIPAGNLFVRHSISLQSDHLETLPKRGPRLGHTYPP